MNLFILDENPRKAAEMHCDRHVVRMILESAQILSTVTGVGYKPTHVNHPVVKWAGESIGNAIWTLSYGNKLCWQYYARYGRAHKSQSVLHEIDDYLGAPDWDLAAPDTPFTLCMPEECKVDGDAVASYRNYYRLKNQEWTAKGRPMRWRAPAARPDWMDAE